MKKYINVLFLTVLFLLFSSYPSLAKETEPVIAYKVCQQGHGWGSAVHSRSYNGSKLYSPTAGNVKQNAAIRKLKIVLKNPDGSSAISYRTWSNSAEWTEWASSGEVCGYASGSGCVVDKIRIKLTGEYAQKYDVYYRVYLSTTGWLGWAKNGASAGKAGDSAKIQAIQIQLVAKGTSVPDNETDPYADLLTASYQYNWLSCNRHDVTKSFLIKTAKIADKLGVAADDLMTVMCFESDLNHRAVNSVSGATGLIQFMPSTARSLGTTTSRLKSMQATVQLNYVYRYLNRYNGKMSTLGDLYMAVLWPKAVGRSDSYVLWSRGSVYYSQNSGLDYNHDGRVTKAETVRTLLAKRKRLIGA
jgi:uncharacterized protein YjdB